jgi:hypothetical protein
MTIQNAVEAASACGLMGSIKFVLSRLEEVQAAQSRGMADHMQ